MNVADSDGTLVIVKEPPIGGTLLTIKLAKKLKKPCLVFYLLGDNDICIMKWIRKNNIKILNVAGPRESQTPGIYQMAYSTLLNVLASQV